MQTNMRREKQGGVEFKALLAPLLRHRVPREEGGERIMGGRFPKQRTQTDPPINPPPSTFDDYVDSNVPVEF